MSNKTVVQLGLFCATLVALKWLWENEAALNAIVLFGTAGVVPGTDIVLTPEQVYMVLGGVLFVSVVAIFWRNIVRTVRRSRTFWVASRGSVPEEGEARESSAIVPSAATPAKLPDTQPKPVVVITIPAQPSPLVKAWRVVRPQLLIALAVFLKLCIKGLGRMSVAMRRLSLWLYRYGVRLWMWAEPRIRRFDKQIEITVKKNKDLAAALRICSTAVKVANERIAAFRARRDTRYSRAPEE